MATISARINDKTKLESEKIAGEIGLSLSNVINVFLCRFVAERGFPFEVTVPREKDTMFDKLELQSIVEEYIKKDSSTHKLPESAYIDPNDNKIKFTK